ncbi:DUF2344 domain-containing protein [Alkalibaculum sp. M08DMB]|uniref:DUF2344 domain-containing protein n=1 Tax=Alkalibaculum sporogenes TaxID=2655001 RepID=A0A6A7KAR2_9FIRM|nr:TIGR03936 family radical SAM-associated protein [Alkalibaculum sporogenes]MPW26600.1 DUF2344 domain-containing protein [Alkalibaculum sporogenes]
MTVARIKYGKGNELKYISHLDFMRAIHRMLNRAGMEVAHSQGFNPHPKVSFAMAMPVGMTSEGDYLDVEFNNSLPAQVIKRELVKHSPPGLDIIDVKVYEQPVKSISAQISQGIFNVEIALDGNVTINQIDDIIQGILDQEHIELPRKNKKGKIVLKDIRPHIKKLHVAEIKQNILKLDMVLSIGSNENLNPQMLIDYITSQNKGIKAIPFAKIHRIDMIVSENKTPMDI